jgi:hypothetical protein
MPGQSPVTFDEAVDEYAETSGKIRVRLSESVRDSDTAQCPHKCLRTRNFRDGVGVTLLLIGLASTRAHRIRCRRDGREIIEWSGNRVTIRLISAGFIVTNVN